VWPEREAETAREAEGPDPCLCGGLWADLAKMSLDCPGEDMEDFLTPLPDPRLLGGLLRLRGSFALARARMPSR